MRGIGSVVRHEQEAGGGGRKVESKSKGVGMGERLDGIVIWASLALLALAVVLYVGGRSLPGPVLMVIGLCILVLWAVARLVGRREKRG